MLVKKIQRKIREYERRVAIPVVRCITQYLLLETQCKLARVWSPIVTRFFLGLLRFFPMASLGL